MSKSLFVSHDYKSFLKTVLAAETAERGLQSRMAEAAGIQRSFLSQVLNGPAQLTAESAEALTRFFKFNEDETEFFLQLVARDRAGTRELRARCESRCKQLKEKMANLSKRFEQPTVQDVERQAKYYNSWIHSAVHVLITIPDFQTVEKISARLGLPLQTIEDSLTVLNELQLAEKRAHKWYSTERSIHLGTESPLVPVLHQNWRARALVDLQCGEKQSVHYSAVHSLSKTDVEKLRHMILEFIDATRKVVAPSKEEDAVCFNVDFFRL